RCLICEPLLILLDEPFTGIDPITIADIRQIVRGLAGQGIGILLTDHNVREALKITDRSYLIKGGQVRTHGSPSQIIRDPIAIREYLGEGFSDDSFAHEPEHRYTATVPQPPIETAYTAPQTPHLAPPEVMAEDVAPPPASAPTAAPRLDLSGAIDGLKSPDAAAAAQELIRQGAAALPALFEALERRDVEMRRQAFQVLQVILN